MTAPGLVEFLEARLAEDEAMAQGAAPHFPGEVAIVENVWEDAVAHIAHQNPARVLAEVAAKRRIVEDLGVVIGGSANTTTHSYGRGYRHAYEDALRALASVYAGHPDYDPGWA